MPRVSTMPRQLAFLPFVGSRAVAEGLLTKAMLRGPSWHRLLPDVYVHVDGYRENDHRMWCDAAALVLPPGAAIGGLSAAYLWGVDLLPRTGPVSVVLPEAVRLRPRPQLTVTRSTLSAQDVTTFAGLPVTTPVRTAFDLGRRPPRTSAVVAIDALFNRRLVKPAALSGYFVDRAGWPGVALLREVLSLAEPESESPMETRLRLVLVDADLPAPTPQYDVYDAQGRFLGRVDLAYPRWRIALEYEGDHHRDRQHFRRDVARLNALRAAGWIVLRFTADDVLRNPTQITRLASQAIRERTLTGTRRSVTGTSAR
ncbi:DUF559 domain-containing protein [Plantactinospora solaniradicis]|uniref:DUF559 domain-containing protein n=1 Tax=Plantactinospora solaniradicis TaxID=1723736 RepID=A0ABW1KEG4_9ACTN